MRRTIILGMFTLSASAFLILLLSPSLRAVGSYALGHSAEPLLDGFIALFMAGTAKALTLVAIVGLIASVHTIIFAQGRQIFSRSRAGYFPTFLSVTHGTRKTPNIVMNSGAIIGLSIMLILFGLLGAETDSAVIGGTLLNVAVFGAMCSYIDHALSFDLLRKNTIRISNGLTGARSAIRGPGLGLSSHR